MKVRKLFHTHNIRYKSRIICWKFGPLHSDPDTF